MARAKGKASKGNKGRNGANDEDGVQKRGKLMLNNPIIPADMDEDIDDDLAFDSEDEALYGQFFSKTESKPSSAKGGNKKQSARGRAGDGEFPEEQFDAIDKAEKRRKKRGRSGVESDEEDALYNYHEDGQSSDDDGDDYIDLSDMFDLTMEEQHRQKKEAASKTKKKNTSSTSADGDLTSFEEDAGALPVAKKRRDARVTEEAESLYGMAAAGVDGEASSYGSALRTFVKGKQADTPEEDDVRQRLRGALMSKHNLLSLDAEDSTKDRATRREVRAVVENNLQKYKPLLRELNTAKHVQFPMKAPDSTPTPSSIGGIVAAAEARFSKVGRKGDGAGAAEKLQSSDAAGTAGKLANRVNDLLSRAGLSRGQLQESAEDSASPNTESIGDYVKFDEEGNEDGDFRANGDESAPSRSYVAKLKAMLAYENSRRKRFNRIKSKTYRRILRKEKDREKERREKAFELLHPELARKRLAEKLLKARAEERITQKHKNTSAWVKHAKRFTDFDANAKDAINEQHSLHQRLMQKMEQEAGEENYERYLAGDDDKDSAVSSEEERVVDDLLAATAANGKGKKSDPATAKLATSLLWRSVEDGQGEGAPGGRSDAMKKARAELGQMKFMKNAREREEKDYEAQMQALQDDIRRVQRGEGTASDVDDRESESENHTDELRTPGKGVSSIVTAARKSFGIAKKEKQAVTAAGTASNATQDPVKVESIHLKTQSGLRAGPKTNASHEFDVSSAGESNRGEEAFGFSDAEEEEGGVKGSTDASTKKLRGSQTATKKSAKKSAGRVASKEVTDGVFAGLRKTNLGSGRTTSTRVVVKPGTSTVENNNTVAVQDSQPVSTSLQVADRASTEEDLRAHQEYLISRAFAHDDVDEDFLKDKEAQVEAIMRPEDRNENLPGWGEWGGEDARLNQRHQEKLAHTGMQKQIERSFLMKSRADASLDHVIINHDGVELVPDRMTLHMVPRPFNNPQEFARSMRQPLGPEWSSALGFKESVQPRVEVQQGHSVLPLDISLRGKKRNATKRRKTDVKR